MNGWLALPLTLLLGQTPTTPPTPATPEEEQAPGLVLGADAAPQEGQADAPGEEERERTTQELERLRTRLEALQADVEAQRQQDEERFQALQQQQALQQERAQELERLRQVRLESLQRAHEWLRTADELLESGELDIGPALASAQQELSTALGTAAEAGRGETTLLLERALERLSTVDNAVSQRDIYPARLALQGASFELQQAWRLTLNRQGTTLVNQGTPDVTP
jgi:vacuolar-type H+-ATPase subunit I/STV1